MSDNMWLQILFSGILATLMATAITVLYEESRGKQELAITLFREYLNQYQAFAEVKWLLEKGPATWKADMKYENQVRKLGDWLDYAAALYQENLVNRKLFKTGGLDREIREFYTTMQKSDDLSTWAADWDQLYAYCQP